MDFSQFFSSNANNDNFSSTPSFEDKVTAKIQSTENENTSQSFSSSNNMFEKLLPLLAGGKNLDAGSLMQMIGSQNPQMNNLMSLMPLLQKFQQQPTIKTQSKKKFEYIKISEYYKK